MRGGADVHAAVATVEAGVIAVVVHDDISVNVCVVHDRDVHVVDCAVVIKVAAIPLAADVAAAVIAEPIVDAAVESDGRAPIAGNENVCALLPSPVAGRPEKAGIGSFDPRAGHPIVVFAVPGPIAGRPDVIGIGTRRLLVNR